MAEKTGLIDKHGRPICVGDLVQYKLSDSTQYIIGKQGKTIVMITPGRRQQVVGSVKQHTAEFMTVIEPAS